METLFFIVFVIFLMIAAVFIGGGVLVIATGFLFFVVLPVGIVIGLIGLLHFILGLFE